MPYATHGGASGNSLPRSLDPGSSTADALNDLLRENRSFDGTDLRGVSHGSQQVGLVCLEGRRSNPSRRAPPRIGAVWFAIFVTFVLLCLRPISADDVWWQLSRGRAVLAGTVSPSRSLLANDDASEADWLGGVPSFAAYRECGTSGLLLLRAILIAATLFCLMFNRTSAPRWIELPVLVAAVLAAGDAWEPPPAAVGCVVSGAACEGRFRLGSPQQSPIPTGVIGLLLLWANLGPRVVLGAIWVALSRLGRDHEAPVHNVRSRWLVKSGCPGRCSARLFGDAAWLVDSLGLDAGRVSATGNRCCVTRWDPLATADCCGLECVALGISVPLALCRGRTGQ